LENENIIQLWCDVRGDADALFGDYKIKLGNVVDVQFMELATRIGSRSRLGSLKNCMAASGNLFMSKKRLNAWLYDKAEGKFHFSMQGYGVLDNLPL
jgi:exonuclease 3'-5' domain-containing protein 1